MADAPGAAGLGDRAARGVPWATLAFGANKAVTVGTTFVLARLLAPSDFGVVALGLLTVGVLTVFGNLGLSGALVLRLDLDDRGKGTVLSLMLVMALLMAIVVAATAPLTAAVFGEPRLRGVLLGLALFLPPSGVTWFYEAVMQRELEFRSRFLAQSVQSLSLAGISIAAALAGLGVWSLVLGQVGGATLYAIALLVVTPDRVRPAFQPSAARAVVRTGRPFIAQGGLAFLKQNTDYVVVGRFLGAAPLGFYSVAYRMAELPYWGIADPVAKVTFPTFARMHAAGDDVRRPFLGVLQSVALVACPVGVILSGAADPFTRALLGDRWAPMVMPLTVLGIWGALRPVHGTIGWLYNSLGMAGVLARVSAATLSLLIPGLVLAARSSGTTAVAVCLLAELVVATAVLVLLARRRIGITALEVVRALGPVAAGAVAAWVASRGAAVLTSGLAHLVRLLVSAGAGGVAYVLAVVALDRQVVERSRGQLRRMRGRGDRPPMGAGQAG